MSCPICAKRKPQRFCPARGETICAVCCATEREVTISCPTDCRYLLAARRQEREHPRAVPPEELPFPEVTILSDIVHTQGPVVAGLGLTILKFAQENAALTDPEVREALTALAEMYRTLGSGIYYEKPPAGGLAQALYAELAGFLPEYKRQETAHTGSSPLKDSEIFHLLVFLLRVERQQCNGRPRSRAFLDFLRQQFPGAPEAKREGPRIILP